MMLGVIALGSVLVSTTVLIRGLTTALLHFARLDVTERLEDNAPTPHPESTR
jgi:hypothetical protein